MKVGDIFYTSWGYDQTNIDFAQIVEISPSGKTVKCRMMSKERVGKWNVRPTTLYGVVFRLHVRRWNGEAYLRGSYPFVQGLGVQVEDKTKWGTALRRGSFSKYTKPIYETPIGMGH